MSAHLVDTVKVPAVRQSSASGPDTGSRRAESVVRGGPIVSVPLAAGAIAAGTPSLAAATSLATVPDDRSATLSRMRRERRERRRIATLSILALVAALGATVLLLDMVR